jgi:hypothetical protein
MSLTARLYLKGHKQEKNGIKVLSCNYSFSQKIDEDGYIAGSVRAGLINLTLTAINDTEIVQWMILRNSAKSGKISFFGIDPQTAAPQESKTLQFEDGILINYGESFTDEADMVMNLSISARKITLSNSEWETVGWGELEK